jgi:hypothetical protein
LWIAFLPVLGSSSIIWKVNWWPVEISCQSKLYSGVQMAIDHSPHLSSSRFSWPSRNLAFKKKTCTRELCHCHLFNQLEILSSCFAHLETKPNLHSLLHCYKQLQWYVKYELL